MGTVNSINSQYQRLNSSTVSLIREILSLFQRKHQGVHSHWQRRRTDPVDQRQTAQSCTTYFPKARGETLCLNDAEMKGISGSASLLRVARDLKRR